DVAVRVVYSSRRRHTRCYRDWSSDVCSSDLANLSGGTLVTEPKGIEPMTDPGMIHAQDQRSSPDRRAAGESDVPVEEGGHGREEIGRASCRESVEGAGDDGARGRHGREVLSE